MASAASTWPDLLAGRKAKASEVEAKFDWLQGNMFPHFDGTRVDNTYNLGNESYRFLGVYTRSLNPTTSAAGIAIGKASADANTVLDLSAFQKALYLPILTTAERNALTPQAGFIIYNSTAARMERYEGGQWLAMNNPIGLVSRVTATSDTTAAADVVNISGSGRLVHVLIKKTATSASTDTCQIIIDGSTFTTGPANFTTTHARIEYRDTTSAIFFENTSAASPINLDVNFKASLQIVHARGAGAGAITTYVTYERN